MTGTAGGSARREAGRRRRRARLAAAGGKLSFAAACAATCAAAAHVSVGRPVALAAAVTAGVCTVVAIRAKPDRWAAGADGEAETARVLAPLARRGFVVLYDVRPPGWRGNIDAIVVGPTGVVVVETKRWRGNVVVSRRRLRLNGTARPEVIEQVAWQVRAVERLIPDTAVRSVLCIHGARVARAWWPGRTARIGGLVVTGGDRLARRISRGRRVLSGADIKELAADLESTFVSAV